MRYQFQAGDQVYEISIERHGEHFQAAVNGEPYEFEVLDTQPGEISLRFADRPITLYWAADGKQKWVSLSGCTYRLDRPSPRMTNAGVDADGSTGVRAPMPAQVRAVQVEEGDQVEKGQTLLLLEAMKMEIRIKAPAAGSVKRLLAETGQTVEKDQLLAEVLPNREQVS